MTDLPLMWRWRATVACLVIPLLVNAISFSTVVKRIETRRPARLDQLYDVALARWVNAFLARLPDAWYPTCLRRCAVLYHLLRRAGRAVHLCVGVQRGGSGKIDAHAWLVLNDVPYLEPPNTDPGRYTEIARFPERPYGAAIKRHDGLPATDA